MSSPQPLSKDELRRRRLAALSGGDPSSGSPSSPSHTEKKARSHSPPSNTPMSVDHVVDPPPPSLEPLLEPLHEPRPEDDDEDEELKRALAMSMGPSSSPPQPTSTTPSNNEADEIAQAIALSLRSTFPSSLPPFQSPFNSVPQQTTSFESSPLRHTRITSPYTPSLFRKIMWGTTVTDSDMSRWKAQGITTVGGTSSCSWGLSQSQGGPCGILAVLGGEIIRWIVYGGGEYWKEEYRELFVRGLKGLTEEGGGEGGEKLDEETEDRALAMAIGAVLARAGVQGVKEDEPSAGVRVITGDEDAYVSKGIWLENTTGLDKAGVVQSLAVQVAEYLLTSNLLAEFKQPGGVLLIVHGLFATRGYEQIVDDMDDDGCAFTAQWGHCSQELINLLLTGCATSNVFDGIMDMGGLQMKGCIERPNIGYLTQLEALRYVQTGTYYKTPLQPIWLIGSSSHFSIMFSLDEKPIRESNSDKILERCRRAFKTVDGDGDGFIQMTSLREVLVLLDLMEKVTEEGLPRLADSLEEAGCGIILWDGFWKATSRLLTGAGLESVLATGSEVTVVEQEGKEEGKAETKLNFEVDELGDSFVLYHYNGLRSGTVTPFLVQRLSAEDAVGASVAMETAGGGGGGGDRGLEEVARTRWPSARFDWFGQKPPSID
ncbi:hypothetical protein TrVE_jg2278 [Triparma verrucosa]|uniref:ubiquitinyl hydrolase 1 n=1 Tax=Triparma verrucosa TaxID=1606542 RepID=A0A9W7FEI8_9STRA|nr:hypothetical protein TrVE_jg2278 [Triparma verrucosa]